MDDVRSLPQWLRKSYKAIYSQWLCNNTTMITDFFRLWMARVQDSGAAIADPGTIRDYHCQLSQSASDRTTESDRCEEREPSAPTLFYFVKQVNESGSIANKQIQLGPYNGIQTGF